MSESQRQRFDRTKVAAQDVEGNRQTLPDFTDRTAPQSFAGFRLRYRQKITQTLYESTADVAGCHKVSAKLLTIPKVADESFSVSLFGLQISAGQRDTSQKGSRHATESIHAVYRRCNNSIEWLFCTPHISTCVTYRHHGVVLCQQQLRQRSTAAKSQPWPSCRTAESCAAGARSVYGSWYQLYASFRMRGTSRNVCSRRM